MASALPLLPAEVRAPPVSGQEGGVARGPSSSWEEAGKRRGARRMCGSACLPGGGAASPALPLPAPPSSRKLGCHHPGRPWKVMGRGAGWDLSKAEARAWLVQVCNPPARLTPTRRRLDTSVLRAPGDSQSRGAAPREVPRLLHFSIDPSWKLSHGRTLLLPWEERRPDRTATPTYSNETRFLGPQNPVCIPCGHL